MAPKNTYSPPKTFDSDFAAFVEMVAANKWTFPGIVAAALQAEVKAQRAERAKHDALQLEYLKEHQRFRLAQAERYALFASALHAARGVFRNNKEVLAQLARFKSSRGGRKKSQPAPVRPPVRPIEEANKPAPADPQNAGPPEPKRQT